MARRSRTIESLSSVIIVVLLVIVVIHFVVADADDDDGEHVSHKGDALDDKSGKNETWRIGQSNGQQAFGK